MHRALSARWLSRTLRLADTVATTSVPTFLCPAVARSTLSLRQRLSSASPGISIPQRRRFHADPLISNAELPVPDAELQSEPQVQRRLPLTCSGCGAFSQTTDPQHFGFYDTTGGRTRQWLQPVKKDHKHVDTAEDDVVAEALKGLDSARLKELGLDPERLRSDADAEEAALAETTVEKPPVCDRCHNLVHHGLHNDLAQIEMFHPTVDSLRETIEESPYKYNHIYHVVDAADFPMSLIPRLSVLLGDIPLRTRNRRTRSAKYYKDRKTEMSFIITRADLLGPTKEIVDNMMPYLQDVLREALGRMGSRIRLGNLRCVSAKRGWWTKPVKDDVWARGGAGWMVGKVNVGKSQLFEAIYPKGKVIDTTALNQATASIYPRSAFEPENETDDLHDDEVGDLLPPPQPESQYPQMPLVSSLPGTTASPIRVPFGNGKGELIDLPGLARSDLELFVKPEHRTSLIMQKRVIPEQHTLDSRRSIVLGGGLIRITPQTPNLTFLMYNFTPLKEHLTSTEKAEGFQAQSRESTGLENITLPEMSDKMKHAGTFKLSHDVTKLRAGPLTRKNAVGLQVDRLPFRVVSVDLLIEGVGYVEIVAQVRARDLETRTTPRDARPTSASNEAAAASSDPFAAMMDQRVSSSGRSPARVVQEEVDDGPEPWFPAVDVYSPEGRFIGSRQPINGWMYNKPLVKAEHKRSRPRRSMKGQKKMDKAQRRAYGA